MSQPPPAKKQKRASDRITIDVGGTKFVTARSTLTSNSAYFDALLSDEWDVDEDELFLDRVPADFSVLLDYMRREMISIETITAGVIQLADFLGVEKLVLAVKVRWYCSIGKGPVLYGDEEIAVAFDKEHGGITQALSNGLFDYFIDNHNESSDKDYAVLSPDDINLIGFDTEVKITELPKEGQEGQGPSMTVKGLLGALNYLGLNGYNLKKDQMNYDVYNNNSLTFVRKRHSVVQSNSTDIFIPSRNEKQNDSKYVKQFAAYAKNEELHQGGYVYELRTPSEIIVFGRLVPSSGQKVLTNIDAFVGFVNPDVIGNLNSLGHRLEVSDFVTREREIEDQFIFKEYFKGLLRPDDPNNSVSESLNECTEGSIFSRLVLRTHTKLRLAP